MAESVAIGPIAAKKTQAEARLRSEPVRRHEGLEGRPEVEAELGHRRMMNDRPALVAQRRSAEPLAARSEPGPRPIQPRPANRTGLPDRLKSGVESLSGLSLDGVKVHYDSPKPARLGALACAQGGDIDLAPGQEAHLPHEAWHVVQQMQGRVRPTLQRKGASINDDEGLEREADEMGVAALAVAGPAFAESPPPAGMSTVVQRMDEERKEGPVARDNVEEVGEGDEGEGDEAASDEEEDDIVVSMAAAWQQDHQREGMESWEFLGFVGDFTVIFANAVDNDPARYLFSQDWSYRAIVNGAEQDSSDGTDVEEDFDHVTRDGTTLTARDHPGFEWPAAEPTEEGEERPGLRQEDKAYYSFTSTLNITDAEDDEVVADYGPRTGIIAGAHPRFTVSLFG